jgi:hypothetical protein
MTTWTAKNYLISETQNSGNREEKTIRFSTESNNLVFIFSKAINYIYNMSMAVAEPKKGILEQILTLPATKGILDFWDNDEDAAYDDL